jgi:hypothetical protein
MESLTWRRKDADQFIRDTQSHAAFPLIGGGAPTIEELEARNNEIRERFKEIDAEFAGRRMAEESAAEWRDLKAELKENEELVEELRGRLDFIRDVAGDTPGRSTEHGATFSTGRSRGGNDNIWDVATVRARSTGVEDESRMLRENASRALEQMQFPHESARREDCQAHVERLITSSATASSGLQFKRHILSTGSPQYRRAFAKAISGAMLTTEEQRSLSLTSARAATPSRSPSTRRSSRPATAP